jgi:chorismate mutase / prephenate dehydratase
MSDSGEGGWSKPQMLSGLDDLRAQLDEIDRNLLKALVERDRVVREVAQRKSQRGDAKVRDPVREEAMIARLTSEGQEAGLDGFYVGRLFRELLDHSVRLQQEHLARLQEPSRQHEGELIVAYQGVDGAYSHLAAMRHFGPRGGELVFRGYPSFRAMMEAVRDGQAHYGVQPIENTTAGSINDAYDLLAQMDLSIVGEEVQRVDHCLVAIEQVPVSKIRRVFSHPQALAQCSNFLTSLPDCQVESFTDTAMAVQRVGREQDLTQAAIASEDAARRYGLTVIKRDITNQKENYTRMVVVAARPERVDLRIAAKTSLVLALKHEQGALLSCLSALAQRGLNLTKLESRPRLHTPWEYLFYLDFEGNIDDPAVQEALTELRTQTSFLRVLGSYPARRTRDPQQAMVQAREPLAPPAPTPAAAPRMSERAFRREDTVIDLGNVLLGGDKPVWVAMFGAHQGREQLLDHARAAAKAGAHVLRIVDASAALGGAKVDELLYAALEEVAKLAPLKLALDVSDARTVDAVARRADLLVVPATHMNDEALLHELGRLDRPVLLERHPLASLDEWLRAADAILARGNHRVALCDAGTRALDTALSRVLDVAALALLRDRSHLPLIVDPARASARPEHTLALATSSLAAGAQGVCLKIAFLGEASDHGVELSTLAAIAGRSAERR